MKGCTSIWLKQAARSNMHDALLTPTAASQSLLTTDVPAAVLSRADCPAMPEPGSRPHAALVHSERRARVNVLPLLRQGQYVHLVTLYRGASRSSAARWARCIPQLSKPAQIQRVMVESWGTDSDFPTPRRGGGGCLGMICDTLSAAPSLGAVSLCLHPPDLKAVSAKQC